MTYLFGEVDEPFSQSEYDWIEACIYVDTVRYGRIYLVRLAIRSAHVLHLLGAIQSNGLHVYSHQSHELQMHRVEVLAILEPNILQERNDERPKIVSSFRGQGIENRSNEPDIDTLFKHLITPQYPP